MKMNLFDKICAVLAMIIGALFCILGVMGVFLGCSANFTLPPILGGLPLLVGWGIIKPILVAWTKKSAEPLPLTPAEPAYPKMDDDQATDNISL